MSDKLIQLRNLDENNNTINVFPYTKAKGIIFDNGKTLEEQISNHNHANASANRDGLMSKEEFIKLLNIEPNANKYYHPETHNSTEILHENRRLSEILNTPSVPSDLNVDSITIGNKFKIFLNNVDNLEIMNIENKETLLTLTPAGKVTVTKELIELDWPEDLTFSRVD